MFKAIKNNSGYIVILAVWSIAGMLFVPLSVVVILSTLILFFRKERYFEALFGMFFLFVLSDNREDLWYFAKVVKPYYLLLFGVLTVMRYSVLIKYPKILKHFTIYLLIALFCVIFSDVKFIAIQKVISYALILLVVPNIVLYEYRKLGRTFFQNIIAFSIIIHFISLSVILTFPEVGISHGNRWRGMFGNPNSIGLFLVVFYTLYGAVKYEFPGIFTKNENRFYILLSFIFLWMSGSRTALISILSFEFILFGFRYSKGITIILLVILLSYFDYIYALFVEGLFQLGLGEQLRLDNIEEGSGRLIAWIFAWEVIQEKTMFIGKGMGFDEALMRGAYRTLSRLGHEGGVHNSYLIIWLNTGLIGLIAFLGGFFSLMIEGIKNKRYGFPLLCAAMISANFEPWLSASLNPYTCVFLVTVTLMLKINNGEKETLSV